MFRIKIALVLLVVFSSVGGVVYLNIADAVTENAENSVIDHLSRARRSAVQSREIRDFAIEAKAQEVAQWRQFGQLLGRPDSAFGAPDQATPITADDALYARHQAVYEEVLVWQAKLRATAGLPDQPDKHQLVSILTEEPSLIIIIDAKGVAVADASEQRGKSTQAPTAATRSLTTPAAEEEGIGPSHQLTTVGSWVVCG